MLIAFFRSGVIKTALSLCLILWPGLIGADEERLSYPEVGVTGAMFLAPSIGYWWGKTGVRFSGAYVDGDHHEYHLNLGYQLSDSENVQHSLNLLTSRVVGSDPGADYRFWATGIAYGMNYKGFFFELGLARPWQDELGNLENDPVIPCGYWGYIYRFQS